MTSVTSSILLERYDAMWRLSQHMLTAAKQAEWDRLIELEQARTVIVEELKREDKILWQAAEGSQKEVLIRTILATDAEIKVLTESWMGELRGTLESIGTEKKLKKAYESP